MAILTNKQMVGNVKIMRKRSILLISLLFFVICIKAQSEYASFAEVTHEAYTKRTSLKKLIKQAHKGDVDAQFQLGHDYYWGLIAEDGLRDYKSARTWLAMAAANGHSEAQTYLGRIYRYGRGVEKDLAAAETYFNQARRNGFNEVYFDLGEMLLVEEYPQKDIQKGLDYMLRAAEGGSALAISYLSSFYFYGENVPQDYKKALYWAEQGIKQNSTSCYGLAGFIYANSLVDVKDGEIKGLELFKKGASIGDYLSQYYLSKCYLRGELGVEKDSAKYVYWLRKSADEGMTFAQNELGFLLYENGNSRKDSLDALKYTKRAAEGGDPASQNLLGYMYHEGYQTSVDQKKAFEYFQKAADQGNNAALSNLGLYYADGLGGHKRDVYKAYKYYGEAIQAGSSNAISSLSHIADLGTEAAQDLYNIGTKLEIDLENGTEKRTPENLSQLFNCYKQSAEAGNSLAQYEVGLAYSKGIGVSEDQKEAFQWYKKAVDNGNHNAICNLAYHYNTGSGTALDHDKAYELYYLDAMMGDMTDQYNLALYYYHGWGNVKKDLNQARHWFMQSADQGYEKAKKMLANIENSEDDQVKDVSTTDKEEAKQSIRQRRIALIVGNQSYKSKPLRNVLNDANALRRKLSLLGFDDVRILCDATRLSMDTCITNFSRDASQYDVALFFYSGHGIQINNENYLLPIDINMKSDEYAGDMCTKLSDIFNKMEKSRCPIKIAIIDACRDNPFENAQTSKGSGSAGGLADVTHAPDGMYIAFSTLPGQTASDGKSGDKNSPFARALLELMGQPGLEINQIFNRVGSLVRQYTGHNQMPHRQSTLTTDFYFNEAEKVYSK